jgi:hypothetical protein
LIVLLDSGPLGKACHPTPKPGSEDEAVQAWLQAMVGARHRVLVPAVADYEVRRSFLLTDLGAAVQRLDTLKQTLGFVSLTDEALLQASAFWARVRKGHQPTAGDQALDGDAILAAQAATLRPENWGSPGDTVIIATLNLGHLNRFGPPANLWSNIQP